MGHSGFLERMAETSRSRAHALRMQADLAGIQRRARDLPPARIPNLSVRGFDVLAEIKRTSPAAGTLADAHESMGPRATIYEHSGAAAISVLTEPTAFGGSLDDLAVVARAVSCPAMRKDFLVDPIQVLEARCHGASGVLLIMRLLDEAAIESMIEAAATLGVFVVLEILATDDVPRLEHALLCADRLSVVAFPGINCRDLTTLDVDRRRHVDLIGRVPAGLPVIAESGVAGAADVETLASLGYRAALIGTALMKAADPEIALGAFLAAGRRAAVPELRT